MLVLLSLALLVLGGGAARAERAHMSAQSFRPSPFPGALFGAHGVRLPPHLSVGGSLLVGYGYRPLSFVGDDPRVSVSQDVVRHQVLAELSVWTAFFDRYGVGVTLPLSLLQTGETGPLVSLSDFGAFAVGDLRLSPHVVLFWSDLRRVGLALDLTVELPTGQSERFAGERNAVFSPRLALEWAPESVRLLVNLGYRLREDARLASLRVRDQILFDVALSVALWRTGLSLVGELEAALSAVEPLGGRGEDQAEIRMGLSYDGPSGFLLRAGAGFGVSSGWGTPDFRGFLQVGYAGRIVSRDPDGDGLVGAADACPFEPEDFDGFEDEDGCPDPDNDGDGIPDAVDRCPMSPEDLDGFQDEDGCPESDVIGQADRPEGAGASRVREFGGRLVLPEPLFFEGEGGDVLTPASVAALGELAAYLLARPELRLRVEAHSDGVGDYLENQRRTGRQAAVVVADLVRQGVSRDRLRHEGLGESRPIAPNTDPEGRAENRRVEFWVEGG